jgi:hypothetical protein
MGDYLQHWQYEAFKAHWPARTIEDALIAFSLNPVAASIPPAGFRLRYQDLLLKPAEKKP